MHSYMLSFSENWSGLVGNLAVSSLVIQVPSNGLCANKVADPSSTSVSSSFFINTSPRKILATQQKGSARDHISKTCAGLSLGRRNCTPLDSVKETINGKI